MKQCSKCKEQKDKKEFYKCKESKDGLTYQCKDCNKEYARKWKAKNRPSVFGKPYKPRKDRPTDAPNSHFKWCSRCEQWVNKSEFAKSPSTIDKLTSYCRRCATVLAQEHRSKNKKVNKNRIFDSDGTKKCAKCKEIKSITEFYKSNSTKDGLYHTCIKCAKAYQKPILLKQYGLTEEMYNIMGEKQDWCCAICGKHQDKLDKTLAVDHNHETEKVRELLCGNCNRAIGLFMEDPELLEKGANYIRKHGKND